MVKLNEPVRAEDDRVRRNTSDRVLETLDGRLAECLEYFAAQPVESIGERIEQLRREWSVERYLQLSASAMGLATLTLAITHDRRWGYATIAALSFFLLHAQQGFDPPLSLLRRLGVRTRREIDWEIYALKVLRGDFDETIVARKEKDVGVQVEAAWRAVDLERM